MNWYTTQDVAEELETTPRTVERWREKGTFVPVRRTRGNHSRYSREQVMNRKNENILKEMLG